MPKTADSFPNSMAGSKTPKDLQSNRNISQTERTTAVRLWVGNEGSIDFDADREDSTFEPTNIVAKKTCIDDPMRSFRKSTPASMPLADARKRRDQYERFIQKSLQQLSYQAHVFRQNEVG